MTGISKVTEKLKKKLSFSDYSLSENSSFTKKTTVYLPEPVNRMLNEIYSVRMAQDHQADKLNLICEAIQLLHQKATSPID